ncbi:MAG TPA: DnaJ C-terminal domain-containing protein [Polyangia bacterium]|jgi:DnaJ-class molecular chaperone|nr:DnaJ C-terminal domain-containing protein [Polyangia bacterium]
MKDLYKVLGVAENADEASIKKAYRKLAKEYHPDVTGNDKKKTERFKEINEAYAVLGDKDKRAEYERLRHAPVRPDGMPEGFDAEAFARTFGGGGMRGGRAGSVSFDTDDLGDLFATLFGEGGGRPGSPFGGGARVRPARGADVIGTLPLTFSEAALGTRRTVRTGSGSTVEVSVPPGVESGGRLRVAGHGQPAPGKGGAPGDLYLELEVRPDAHLQRDGADVLLDVPVTFSEAALGTKVQVPTIEGPVTVTIPPGTSSGARLRLRGKGIKKPDGSRGDQMVRVEIVAPKGAADDPETRKLLEALAKRTEQKSPRPF